MYYHVRDVSCRYGTRYEGYDDAKGYNGFVLYTDVNEGWPNMIAKI